MISVVVIFFPSLGIEPVFVVRSRPVKIIIANVGCIHLQTAISMIFVSEFYCFWSIGTIRRLVGYCCIKITNWFCHIVEKWFCYWFYNWFYTGAAGSAACRQEAQIPGGMPPDPLFATQNGILQVRFPLEWELRGDTVEPGLHCMAPG